MIKVALSTLGCKVNQYESAGILEALDKEVFSVVPFHAAADCYIINTCTVTHKTDYQARQLIRRAHKTNPDAVIIVTGCYAQIDPEQITRIPGVTLVIGTSEKENIPKLIERAARDNPQMVVGKIDQVREFSGLFPRKFPGHTRTFLKIQDGCNSFCSYCIVPYARGRSRSLPEQDVLDRIKVLADDHFREIVLTGIHIGMYGKDLTPASNLLSILRRVEEEQTLERLRLSSIEISEISDEMIQWMQASKTLCRHLHIPLQSGDDKVLAAMKRNYNQSFFKERLETILLAVPDIAIGLDVLVGFPGEGEAEFKQTLQLIESLPVAYLHVFPYSKRPGTTALDLPDHVTEEEKKRRVGLLRLLGQEKRNAFAEKSKGKKLSVLVENRQDRPTGFMTGYSDNYIPVVLTGASPSLANHIVCVISDDARNGKLYGKARTNDG